MILYKAIINILFFLGCVYLIKNGYMDLILICFIACVLLSDFGKYVANKNTDKILDKLEESPTFKKWKEGEE